MAVRAPKVNHHVQVMVFVDATPDTVRVRPGTITEIAADDNPVIRESRGSATTYGDSTNGVPPYVHGDAKTATTYVPT